MVGHYEFEGYQYLEWNYKNNILAQPLPRPLGAGLLVGKAENPRCSGILSA